MAIKIKVDIPHFETQSHLRLEDRRLVTGAGRYVADLAPPDTVHLAFVRSTEAHALVSGIDVDGVDSTEVLGVFTAADLDLPDIPGDSVSIPAPDFPRPHLARDKVRYLGEPIAVVAATSVRAAVDAAEQIWVEYEPLEAVIDPSESLRDEVILHEAAGTNVVNRFELSTGEARRPTK